MHTASNTVTAPYRQRIRRLLRIVAVLGITAGLAGCQTAIGTTIHVSDSDSYRLRSTLQFDGEIAQLLATDTALLEQLEGAIIETFGGIDERTPGVAYAASFDPEAVGSLSAMTGVSSIDVSFDADTATVQVVVQRPTHVVDAIAEAVSDWPDGPEVLATVLSATVVTVDVTFPGEVLSAVGFDSNGTTAHFSTPIDSLTGPRTLTVVGDTRSRNQWLRWAVAAAVISGLGCVALLGKRR